MKVLFKSCDPNACNLREWATERAAFVFRRYRDMSPRATIQLSDVNGPRGGIDKQCVIEISTAGMAPVIIRSVAHDWRVALNRALPRAVTTLKKLLRRGKDAQAGRLRQQPRARLLVVAEGQLA